VPSLLELVTYCADGSFRSRPGRYRYPAYLSRMRAEDPLLGFAQRLTDPGVLGRESREGPTDAEIRALPRARTVEHLATSGCPNV
jgi:TPP-dependent pyruvate/acetoin dehydrogenase alpha subunit